MADQDPLSFPNGPRQPGGARRLIGPIAPRDEQGRLRLKPQLGKRVKVNVLGEPIRDEKGQPVEEDCDLRDPREYLAYEHGQEIAPGATKGMLLFQVDYSPEPLVLVYARDEADAVKVFKREMGITRFGSDDPKVSRVHH